MALKEVFNDKERRGETHERTYWSVLTTSKACLRVKTSIKVQGCACMCTEEGAMKDADTEGQSEGDQTVVMATDGSCYMVEGGRKTWGGVSEGMMFQTHDDFTFQAFTFATNS